MKCVTESIRPVWALDKPLVTLTAKIPHDPRNHNSTATCQVECTGVSRSGRGRAQQAAAELLVGAAGRALLEALLGLSQALGLTGPHLLMAEGLPRPMEDA